MQSENAVFHLEDICSLSEFQRNAKEHIERLKETGRPQVLTVNGAAAVVVQDAQSYQKMLDATERAQVIEGIRRGLDQASKGKTKPARKALDAIREKHAIPRS
jgi:prevent-host-death family protein